MKIIKPSFEIMNVKSPEDGDQLLKMIEAAGRTCYKSEDRITPDSAKVFAKTILKSGHESVIEHVNISVRIVCDRGVSHEIVRHRMASFSQESTRYCNYCKDKFGNELTFIEPNFWVSKDDDSAELIESKRTKMLLWQETMAEIEENYIELIRQGATPQEARSILPSSLKTEIVMTANPRSWRNFFRLRTGIKAHPQIREIAIPMLAKFKEYMPDLFGDLEDPK